MAQLLFWRPVPSFEPTPAAMAPSVEMVRLQRQAPAAAAAAGELGPGAGSDEALWLASVLISGVIGQAMALPNSPWPEILAGIVLVMIVKSGARTTDLSLCHHSRRS
ncbi:MAG: hypothetical protein L0H64_07670 [Pseudonocardia sp.]|nr:hypothetical protein [Pseudonocardia sp.]